MKRINLKEIQEVLSEKELKNVMGADANNLCDPMYRRKACTTKRNCESNQVCITSSGGRCCFNFIIKQGINNGNLLL